MGLDMYAYVGRPGQHQEYWDQYGDPEGRTVSEPQEIAYWRKHPNLHGWMRKLWEKKGYPGGNKVSSFNGIELELTWDDIDMLEKDIKNGSMANLGTTGLFFGDPSDEYYREKDLQFCVDAKAECFIGRKVFYNSSW